MEEDLLVPLGFFLCIVLLTLIVAYFRYRFRREVQLTLREAIDKGQSFTPEFLTRFVDFDVTPTRDLRRGLLSIAVGVALIVIGVVLGYDVAVRPLLGASALPILVGLVYLTLWRIQSRA